VSRKRKEFWLQNQTELNLLGYRVSEAREHLDHFVSDLRIQGRRSYVTMVVGKGNLKHAVRGMLENEFQLSPQETTNPGTLLVTIE
jgi:dsDNA-specific endonuclease/ATPase MutS2